SSKIVISTGMIVPRWASVWALYALQKSMIATPCGPSAVPTGGAGVAWPAGIWILTTAETFFLAMVTLLLEILGTCQRRAGTRCDPKPAAVDGPAIGARVGGRPRRDAGPTGDQSFATCENSSSTGVSRPKMLTSTLSLSWS